MPVRQIIALSGGLALAGVHFWAGRELIHWAPPNVGRLAGALGVVAVPAFLGMAVVILVNLPLEGTTVGARVAEASIWAFAVLGALLQRRDPALHGQGPALQTIDVVLAVFVVIVVRVMARGIPLNPGP